MATAWIFIAVVFIAVFNRPVNSSLLSGCTSSTWRAMLDAMQSLMTVNGSTFSQVAFSQINTDMNLFDGNLATTHNAAWQGMVNYWQIGGANGDNWGSQNGFRETNITTINVNNMTIYEPCNYASSVAYYYTIFGIYKRKLNGPQFNIPSKYVKALVQAFSSLAFSSAMMHGSRTALGAQLYKTNLNIVAYILHQAMLSPLPTNSSIIKDLSLTEVANSSDQWAQIIQNMYLKLPPSSWQGFAYNSTSVPDYGNVFVAVLATAFSFISASLPVNVTTLASSAGLNSSVLSFFANSYVPAIRNYTANITLTPAVLLNLVSMQSTIFQLLQTLFQQSGRVDNPASESFESQHNMELLQLPNVKDVSSRFGIDSFSSIFQTGVDVFPGAYWCATKYPFSATQVALATAMLNLVYLADNVYSFLATFYPQ